MKTNINRPAVIEWTIAILLFILCAKYSMLSFGSFSPLAAHQRSERTYHYGPSTIIKTVEIPGGRIYLCRYKDWISSDLVKKGIIRWYPGGGSWGKKIDHTDQLTYSWDYERYRRNEGLTKLYGYVNDPDIDTIIATDKTGAETLKYDLDQSRMFIFYWAGIDELYKYKTIQGLNKDGKVVYEKQLFD